MKRGFEETATRTRNIRWKVSTDRIAKTMASKRSDGNVSRLLEELVLREHRDPRMPVAE